MSSPITEHYPETHDQNKTVTTEEYKESHMSTNSHSRHIKKLTFPKIYDVNDDQVQEICETVREAELELHDNPEEAYNCVLKHYDGDHPISARLEDPSGGALLKGKKFVNKSLKTNTRWFGFKISSMFFLLCLHHFDYIKDIGKTMFFLSQDIY